MSRPSSLRLIPVLIVLLAGAALAPSSAGAAFGVKEFDVTFSSKGGPPVTEAGATPFAMTTQIAVNTRPDALLGEAPDDEIKTVHVDLPPGFAGTPESMPECSTLDFISSTSGDAPTARSSLCPDSTAIGTISAGVEKPGWYYHAPVFNLQPDPGSVAKFGFVIMKVPVTIESKLSETAPYHVVSEIQNVSQTLSFFGSTLTLWGNPSDPAHDTERGFCVAVFEQDQSAATPSRGNCPVEAPPKSFLQMPRSCDGKLDASYLINSWQNPAGWLQAPIPLTPEKMSECGKLGFAPSIDADATSASASSATGLDFELSNPTAGVQSDLKKSVVTLPEGFALNPAAAAGLAPCTPADLTRERAGSEPGEGCPEASKVGTVETESPLLPGKLLHGSVFVAQPDDPGTSQPGAENPFDTTFAIYVVIKSRELGIAVKIPGKVEPDPVTGRLTTTFDDLPQVPIGRFALHFRSGARAPLVTPSACGSAAVQAQLTPWANPGATVTRTASLDISSGAGGSSCPAAPGPFDPRFEGGSLNNAAGAYSPFVLRLTRADGEQELTRFSALLPPGVTGKLAGVATCSESAAAAAAGKSGRAELAFPSCPAGSLLGHINAGAGAGPELSFVQGSLYLGGPYQGDPLSIYAVVPAVSGPFDLGTVVVREAVSVDRETAQVISDGARSQAFPRILAGVPLALRDLRIAIDRDQFMINPTGCKEEHLQGTLFGSGGNLLAADDDVAVSRSARYQAAGCLGLGFKPRLSLQLKGGTHRGDNPALTAVLRPRAKDANISRAEVTLPHALFLEQGHIGTICTRVQLAASTCPARSVYGFARAKTPLLDSEVAGPVYLVSSNHALPDLLADLHGQVDFRLRGVISSKNGGLRTVFATAPDVPVERFTLKMKGGKKSLLVNSRNLCAGGKPKAEVEFVGHNTKQRTFKAPLKTKCPKHPSNRRGGRAEGR